MIPIYIYIYIYIYLCMHVWVNFEASTHFLWQKVTQQRLTILNFELICKRPPDMSRWISCHATLVAQFSFFLSFFLFAEGHGRGKHYFLLFRNVFLASRNSNGTLDEIYCEKNQKWFNNSPFPIFFGFCQELQ